MFYRFKGYWGYEELSNVIMADDLSEAIEIHWGKNWTMDMLDLHHYIQSPTLDGLDEAMENYDWREFWSE